MNEHDFHETPNIYPNFCATPLNDQQQFRLNKINEIKDFIAEVKERELMSKRFSILPLLTILINH